MSLTLPEKILQAASELFYSQGIRATGVDAIVKAAKTTKMSLYKYFPSKDDLVLAFLRKRDEDFRVWFAGQVDAKADTPKTKLLAIFDVIGEWMAIPEFRGCAFINAAAEFPLEGNPVHQVSAEFYEHFRNYIADLAGQYGSKSPETLALQLSLLIEGAIVSEQMKRHSDAAGQAKQAAIILIEGSSSHISDISLPTNDSRRSDE
ncbi:MAG: TetR/AcrR family transcriptional regulator [Methylobacter tundripaludum]|nr:TetR/AcrR family transcriptional regulator [Methylobacter tundripaludum]